MKIKLQLLLIGLATASLIACGDNGADDNDVEVDEGPDCGEGTALNEEGTLCILDLEPLDCGDDEVYLEQFHRCARVADDYCADGTDLDEATGRCIAGGPLTCASNTVEEDDQCVVAEVIECGDGTVVHEGQCTPHNEVCADGTTGTPPTSNCRPEEGICGDNTIFDVGDRVCIPVSTLSCGPGTTETNGVCHPTQGFYDELAGNPDIDAAAVDGPHSFGLPPAGERFVFVGNIDAPDEVNGDFIQDQDVFEFSGDAGQWLSVTVYSMGLPEPGFAVTGANDFYRLSDAGAGNETSRTIVLPEDGTFELAISNLPQMTGTLGPAGGENWGYVGFVEILDAPAPVAVDLLNDSVSGQITDLEHNLYEINDLGDLDELLLIFDAMPQGADAELQIWDDPTTISEVRALSGNSSSLTPPSDSFLLLFDYVHAHGADLYYAAQGAEAAPLPQGDSLTEEIAMTAGDYLRLSQFNTQETALPASIAVDGVVVVETASLAISTADNDQIYLYYLADDDVTATVSIANNTDDNIDAISHTVVKNPASNIAYGPSGDPKSFGYSDALLRSQRHYFNLSISYDGLLAIKLDGTTTDGHIILLDDMGVPLEENTNSFVTSITPGDYTIYVESQGTMADGFTLLLEESTIFDISDSSSPNLEIPINNQAVTDTITISSCPAIAELTIDVEIEHTWREDVVVDIIAPNGDTINLHNGEGGLANDVIGTFPFPADSGLGTGEGLLNLIGQGGGGDWVISVRDTWASFSSNGTLLSWGVNLTCEG